MHIRSNQYYLGRSMVVENLEPWISNTEMSKYLGISTRTLKRNEKYFSKGTHYRFKDPLNPKSHKMWKRAAVDQMLSQPDNVLRRRVKRK